jgi:hypothetical protein
MSSRATPDSCNLCVATQIGERRFVDQRLALGALFRVGLDVAGELTHMLPPTA